MISIRTHAIIDYVVGVLLILAPFGLGFATGGPAQWVPVILGIAVIGYSLLTRYEYGVVQVIPYNVHLGLDAASSLVLLVSPWLFGFSGIIWWPHVIFGLAGLAVVAATNRRHAHADYHA